jgi:pilus assembly protein CpaB
VAGALAAGLQALAPRPPVGAPVLVATREVEAGAVLTASDLRVVDRTTSELPQGALADPAEAVGRTLGSGLRIGEALTDARLVGPGLLAGRPADEVAAPVRIADGEAAALLRPGDRVDVLQASGGDGTGGAGIEDLTAASGDQHGSAAASVAARTVVRHATVLARPSPAGSSGGLLPEADPAAGGLLVLAVEENQAADLAEAAARGPLSVVLRRTT